MGSFRFIHMSDLHFLRHYSSKGFEGFLKKSRHPRLNLIDCLRTEKAQGLDFVLITGDLTQEGDDDDFSALKNLLEQEIGTTPVYALPGNHDPRNAFCNSFLGIGYTERVNRVYNQGGLRIVALDTGRGITGTVDTPQLAWLQEVLSTPSSEGTLLMVHHPLIPNQDNLGTAQYDSALVGLIAHSDILGVFCGHTHHNLITQFASKPYYTADSMAYSLQVQGDEASFECLAAYNLLTLSDKNLFAQVKLAAPAPAVAARFSMNSLSQLLSK